MFVAALPVLGQDRERSFIFGCGEEGEEGESCDMRRAMSMGDKSGHLPHLAAASTPLQGAGCFSQLEVLPGGSPLPLSQVCLILAKCTRTRHMPSLGQSSSWPRGGGCGKRHFNWTGMEGGQVTLYPAAGMAL